MNSSNRFRIRRVYEPATVDDGIRVLVDRLWPRGLKKETARVDNWLKDLAPSQGLRRLFKHDPTKWDRFVHRYHEELDAKPQLVQNLLDQASKGTVTLLFAARDPDYNNAVALKQYLERHIKSRPR